MNIKKPVIAIIDDEETIRETVTFALSENGYNVKQFSDGLEAWNSISKELPDLIILDIMMPGLDGLSLCRKIRNISEALPLIFLSSKSEEIDRILGLELGADDYLCKPFSMRELTARVKVLFRRINLDENKPDRTVEQGRESLSMDEDGYQAYIRGRKLQLTVSEFRILNALIKNPGVVKTRENLLHDAYPHDIYVSDRTIDSHIKRLRKKITDIDPAFSDIETLYGLGYRYNGGIDN